jgi:hypothetical protein
MSVKKGVIEYMLKNQEHYLLFMQIYMIRFKHNVNKLIDIRNSLIVYTSIFNLVICILYMNLNIKTTIND